MFEVTLNVIDFDDKEVLLTVHYDVEREFEYFDYHDGSFSCSSFSYSGYTIENMKIVAWDENAKIIQPSDEQMKEWKNEINHAVNKHSERVAA